MKMKNTLLLCLSISLTYACNADNILTEDLNQFEVTAPLETLLDDNNTPLDTSIRCLRDFFATHDVGNMGLKNRTTPLATKTARFNESFLKYIKQSYNQRSYANYLSQDASHVIEFFGIGKELSLTPEYLYVGTRLFYNKFKEAEIINDTVPLELLPAFAINLEPHFDTHQAEAPKEDLEFIKKHTEEVILYKFTEHFTRFQSSPETFIEELSHDLASFYKQQEESQAQALAKNNSKQESLMRLRNMTVRFFELTINKTMWNPITPETIWPSVVALAEGLKGLAQHHILDHMDDLDDLLWTLTHRFCYFVELTGADLPIAFYEKIEEDLVNKTVFFLETKEQDDGITTKKQFIIEALLKGKTRALATQQGLVVGQR